jgi:2-methylisocitrate lyase-like PEP mutase family enzyme
MPRAKAAQRRLERKMGEAGRRLRALLEGRGLVVAPGVYDCLGARLVEAAGFPAVYLTGFGSSASLLGKPDLGYLTLEELARHAGNVAGATSLPLIADAEAGFGNALNTMRAVEAYERAGVAAIHLEDQLTPKRFRPDGRPQLAGLEEHVEKLRAAVEARRDPSFLIIARTDALQRHGLAEAIRRANAYREAGAELLFVHGISSRSELKAVAREVQGPCLLNYSNIVEGGGGAPLLSELAELGYRVVILAGELLFSAGRAMQQALAHLRDRGTLAGWERRLMPLAELRELLGWSRHSELEQRYLPEGEAES